MARELDDTDRLVGENIRLKRLLLRLSQRRLSKDLDISPQQLQKYEKGLNRIGAGRLDQIAKALKVSPTFFFQRAQTAGKLPEEEKWTYDVELRRMICFLTTPEGTRLVSNFMLINDGEMRTRIVDLVESIIKVASADAVE